MAVDVPAWGARRYRHGTVAQQQRPQPQRANRNASQRPDGRRRMLQGVQLRQ